MKLNVVYLVADKDVRLKRRTTQESFIDRWKVTVKGRIRQKERLIWKLANQAYN